MGTKTNMRNGLLLHFSFSVIHYASTPIFLSTGGLASHTCIYGHGGVLSGMAREQIFGKGKKIGFTDIRRLGGKYKY